MQSDKSHFEQKKSFVQLCCQCCCCYNLTVKMLIKVFLVLCVFGLVVSRIPVIDDQQDDIVEQSKEIDKKAIKEADDLGVNKDEEGDNADINEEAKDKGVTMKAGDDDDHEEKERIVKEMVSQYDKLVQSYVKDNRFPRTRKCRSLEYTNTVELSSIHIAGCEKRIIRGKPSKSCSIKIGTPLSMTAAFNLNDVKNLNVSKIKFQVQGQMMFVWVNNPYYKERDLCDNEAFKKLNCIWENKKLVLKINMDAVPSYAAVMISTVRTRVIMMYGEKIVTCFELSINLV